MRGKTLRRSFQKSADQNSRAGGPVHVFPALPCAGGFFWAIWDDAFLAGLISQ
jgi:hypothetical protein